MSTIHISLLGKLQIQHSIRGAIKFEARRDQELFCYLLLNRQRLHQREKIAGLMWAESSTIQSKRNLRQTLWHLQSMLNAYCENSNLLLVENGWIGVNLDADFWLDVAVLENAYAALEAVENTSLTSQLATLLDQAVKLYQGDLFEGCYQDWCIYERERLQNMYLTILERLLGYSKEQQEYERGVNYATQILRYDHAREQTYRQLMRLYYQMGNRSAAIHQYEMCASVLREELGVAPAPSTEALYHYICSENTTPQPVAITQKHLIIQAKPNQEDILQRLERLQYSLSYLQEQVTQIILSLNMAN